MTILVTGSSSFCLGAQTVSTLSILCLRAARRAQASL